MSFITTKFHEILSSGFREVALKKRKKKNRTNGRTDGSIRNSLRGVWSCAANVDFQAYRIYHKIINIHNNIYCTYTHTSQITSDISQDYRIYHKIILNIHNKILYVQVIAHTSEGVNILQIINENGN